MNKKLLLCVVLICTMLASMVSAGAYVSPITYDEALEDSITNLRILESNQLPDGTAIDPSKHVKYVAGGFEEGCQHVADRTFTLSGIKDTDLFGSDMIFYAYETYKSGDAVQNYVKANHNVNNTPGIVNWINFTVNRDADIYVYTSLTKGNQTDNDRALEAAGFTHVSAANTTYATSSVAIANKTYSGKWKKSVKAGDLVSLPSNRSGSAEGRVTPFAVINYTSEAKSGINSGVYVAGLESPAKLYTAVYDANGNLVKTDVSSAKTTGHLSTSVAKDGSQSAKSFLWEEDTLTPVTKNAKIGELSSEVFESVDIRINGVAASEFLGAAVEAGGSYDIGIKENNLHSIPKVTATANDSSVSTVVKTYPEELKTVVRISKGALNEGTNVVTLPSSGTQVSTKRANMETTTVTFNWVKDYITMSDFVPGTSTSATSPNWNPNTYKTLNKRTVKNVTVADGVKVKKVQVKFANLNKYSAIIAVQPAAGSAFDAKTILCDSAGNTITWSQDDTTVVMDYSKKADDWAARPTSGKAYRNTAAIFDAAGTTAKAHYPIIDFKPSGYKTGSRIAINATPAYGNDFLWSLGENEKYLAGSAYLVFDSHTGADKVMTFWVADDAVISVLSQDTTVTFSEDGGSYTAGTEYAANSVVVGERKVSDTDVAWLLLNNIIETNDIYNNTWQNGYYARRLYRPDIGTMLPEYGYTIKGNVVTTGTQYTHLLNMYVEDYEFSYDGALATDFVNHMPTVVHNSNNGVMNTGWKLETEWPPASIFTDRNGINQSNGTGTVVSWPFGLRLEEFDYYVKAFKDYGHMDADDVGGTYTGNHMPMYSFKLNRDAVVAVFHKWSVFQDSAKGIPAFAMDEGWKKIEFDTQGGLVVSNLENSATSYERRPLHELLVKEYKAGDTVTIYTPANNEYIVTFIKELEQSARPSAKLKSIKIDGAELAGFDADTLSYTYEVSASGKTAPVIEALSEDGNAWVSILNPTEFPGSAKINVVSINGNTKTYTINYTCNTKLADNVVGDPDVTSWNTHNITNTFNNCGVEYPVIMDNLQVGSKMIHDRVTNPAAQATTVDASLLGKTYITAGHDWHAGSASGDFDEVYKSSTLNTNWYSFDLKRGATVKIVYEGAVNAAVTNHLESQGYTYNGKSSGNFLQTFTACGLMDCHTMYYKHFDIPEGQDKVTVSMPSFQNREFFVIIDFDGWIIVFTKGIAIVNIIRVLLAPSILAASI